MPDDTLDVDCAKTAEPILLFGLWTWVGRRKDNRIRQLAPVRNVRSYEGKMMQPGEYN